MDEKRLISMEIKMAYQEDTLMQLNDIVCEQQNQIDALERLTQQLLGRVRDLSDTTASQAGSALLAADERPPHY